MPPRGARRTPPRRIIWLRKSIKKHQGILSTQRQLVRLWETKARAKEEKAKSAKEAKEAEAKAQKKEKKAATAKEAKAKAAKEKKEEQAMSSKYEAVAAEELDRLKTVLLEAKENMLGLIHFVNCVTFAVEAFSDIAAEQAASESESVSDSGESD